MKILNDVSNLKGGWFVGNFEPTAYKTTACEVSYKFHSCGEYWAPHYHRESDEINYLLEGEMTVNNTKLSAPCIFVIEKGEIAEPTFITDVRLIVVKIPGIPNDKFEIKEE